MDPSTVEFCHAAVASHREQSGFRATQRIQAGPIDVEALVRVDGRSISVEYRRYVSPLIELEARLTGNVEYLADDLLGMSIHYDGETTWLHDAASNTSTAKSYRALMEPLPGVSAIGELGFLSDLVHEFLLREEKEETIDDRRVRVIGLKPKRQHFAHLLKTTAFPIRRATIAFDTETRFPLRVRIFPASGTSLEALVGPTAHVEVSYHDVVCDPDAELPRFTPPEGAHVFREESLAIDDLIAGAPFSIPLESYRVSGFSTAMLGVLTIDDAGERAHGTILLERERSKSEAESPLLTLRFGNYLARDMARRNVALSEQGTRIEVAGNTIKMLDRRSLWEETVPGVDAARAPIEVAWEQDGAYWFAIGLGVGENTLRRMATHHLTGEPPGEASSASNDLAS